MADLRQLPQDLKSSFDGVAYNVLSTNVDEDIQKALQAEIGFIDIFVYLIKEGFYGILDEDLTLKVIDKTRNDMSGYMDKIRGKIEDLEKEYQTYENQEAAWKDMNHDRAMERTEKEKELKQCSIFDVDKRKQLKEEIKELQPFPAPMNYEEKKNQIRKEINTLKHILEPWLDKFKDLYSAERDGKRILSGLRPKKEEHQKKEKQSFQKSTKAR